MPYPTLTWAASSLRTVAVASTSSTVAELLVGIKAAIDNDSTLWAVSDYSAGNGTLEVRRKGSPTGEQATVRVLFFGGSVPHAAALAGVTASAANLYVAASVDANTTGPAASYTAGAPYSTQYIKGTVVCVGTAIQAAETPRVSLIECEDGISIWLGDINTCTTATVGRLVEAAAADSLMWCVLSDGAAHLNQINASSALGSGAATNPIPPHTTGALTPRGVMWNSTAGEAHNVGRAIGLMQAETGPLLGTNGAAAIFLTVPLTQSLITPFGTQSFFGFLRQIRIGPQAPHLATLRNSAGVTQAIHVGPPVGLTGYGAWFDQVA